MYDTELAVLQSASQYFATLLRSHPEYVDWLFDQKNLYRRYPVSELHQQLVRSLSRVDGWDELMSALRTFKQRHFLRIGGRDFLGKADLVESTAQISDLAGVSLQVGIETLRSHPQWWLGEDDLAFWEEAREAAALTVVGLGKFGGHELNYVSDIDILFLYDSRTERLNMEMVPVLNRFCQSLCRLMGDNHGGDHVFLVDLRLRPQGKDGPLVPSISAASDHYLQFGRPWERQMLLKARPVAGDRVVGMSFIQQVRPFVFRRFLDFQALDELRDMRDRILAEAARPKPGWGRFDVKLGIGGIREVEFLVQSMQLIYGGRQPDLDEPNTLRCIEKLTSLGIFPQNVAEQLREAYIFLRRVEHWVQLDQNRQTQRLPKSEEAMSRLAMSLGFDGGASDFLSTLQGHCDVVHDHFTELFRPVPSQHAAIDAEGGESGDPLEALRQAAPEALERFREILRQVPAEIHREVVKVLGRLPCREVPRLGERALNRFEQYLARIQRRRGLMKVFEVPGRWLEPFLSGLARSELLSTLLIHHPSLVEGVVSAEGGCPAHGDWATRAEDVLGRYESYEEGLEWLRRLKNERILQLALALLRGELGHSGLEKDLTRLADLVIRHTFRYVLGSLHLDTDAPLAVLGLGKLGSGEMGLLSDLDLVFVYEPRAGESTETVPEQYIRLIQRLMRMLSTPLQEGPGYPVDARLRPTGTYGPLVVTRKSWLEYYTRTADLWEIQALLRMRCVAGDPALGQWIEEKARSICFQERDPQAVWERLCHLRLRMQRERAEEKEGAVDIKLGEGGLVDLEFLVQGVQMTQGHEDQALRTRSVREALAPALGRVGLTSSGVEELTAAFESLRALEHALRLHTNQSSSRLQESVFGELRAGGLWPPLSLETRVDEWQDLLVLRRRVRNGFRLCCPDA
jgi:glutamate-ammonia-ligase adenylyltransferase